MASSTEDQEDSSSPFMTVDMSMTFSEIGKVLMFTKEPSSGLLVAGSHLLLVKEGL
jgi:hypothetical protein